MKSWWDDSVGEPFEHQSGVDDRSVLGGHGINPAVFDLDLQASRSGAGQSGDQVDIGVLSSPHMLLIGGLLHRRVVDCPGEVGAVLAANSAAATGGPGGLLDDTAPIPADDSGSEGFAVGPGGDDLLAGEDGPIATTGALTYEMAWAPGASAPHNLGGIGADDGVTVATGAVGEDGTFVVLLVIDSDDDPTEYRFDNSVPEGHTAELQLDGSVQLIDADGNEAGIIATPWALDATGAEIPTSFALDGSTLVQTVNHQGATYPVIADPCGWSWRGALDCLTVAAAAVLVVPACAPPIAIATCGPAVIVATYTYVSIQHPPSPPPPPPPPPTRVCRVWHYRNQNLCVAFY